MTNQFDTTEQDILLAAWHKRAYPLLLALGRQYPGLYIELGCTGPTTAMVTAIGDQRGNFGIITFEGQNIGLDGDGTRQASETAAPVPRH